MKCRLSKNRFSVQIIQEVTFNIDSLATNSQCRLSRNKFSLQKKTVFQHRLLMNKLSILVVNEHIHSKECQGTPQSRFTRNTFSLKIVKKLIISIDCQCQLTHSHYRLLSNRLSKNRFSVQIVKEQIVSSESQVKNPGYELPRITFSAQIMKRNILHN